MKKLYQLAKILIALTILCCSALCLISLLFTVYYGLSNVYAWAFGMIVIVSYFVLSTENEKK